jgi:hypothetical protein
MAKVGFIQPSGFVAKTSIIETILRASGGMDVKQN